MPSWNIDKKIEHLEKQLQIIGDLSISIYRIVIAGRKMPGKGLRPLPWHKPDGEYVVWAFGPGVNELNLRPYYYGHTIHEAYLKMQKVVDRSDRLKIKKRLTKRQNMVKNNRKEILL